MLELQYYHIILQFITENVDLTKIDQKLKNILKTRPHGSIDIDTIDIEKKDIIDKLTKKFGFIKSLVLLDRLKRQVRTLLTNVQDEKLKFDLFLFLEACNSLYEKLDDYFLPNIFYMLCINIKNIQEGSFDPIAFLQTATKEYLHYPMKESYEQTHLEGFRNSYLTREKELSKKYLSEVVSIKGTTVDQLKKTLQANYSFKDLTLCATTFIDLLSIDLKEEHAVIIKSILKAIETLKKRPTKNSKYKQEPIKRMVITSKKEKSGQN